MKLSFALPTLITLLGAVACDPLAPVDLPEPGEAQKVSTAFAVAVDARLGPPAAATNSAPARSIYAIVPN